MNNFLKSLRKYSFIVIATTALLGVLLAAFPDEMLAYSAFVIGGAFILSGVIATIYYFLKAESKSSLVLGVTAVVAGIIICAAYKQIVTVIIFVLGAFLLVGGIVNIINAIYIAVNRRRSWILTVIFSLISIVLGIVSLKNPFETQTTIVRFLGAGLIFFAVFETVIYFQFKKAYNEADQMLSNSEDSFKALEVEFTEVDFE